MKLTERWVVSSIFWTATKKITQVFRYGSHIQRTVFFFSFFFFFFVFHVRILSCRFHFLLLFYDAIFPCNLLSMLTSFHNFLSHLFMSRSFQITYTIHSFFFFFPASSSFFFFFPYSSSFFFFFFNFRK